MQFREKLEREAGLVWTYSEPTRFRDELRVHLHRLLVEELTYPLIPLAEAPAAVLDLEKQRCRDR